jgi:hypothetical protein
MDGTGAPEMRVEKLPAASIWEVLAGSVDDQTRPHGRYGGVKVISGQIGKTYQTKNEHICGLSKISKECGRQKSDKRRWRGKRVFQLEDQLEFNTSGVPLEVFPWSGTFTVVLPWLFVKQSGHAGTGWTAGEWRLGGGAPVVTRAGLGGI